MTQPEEPAKAVPVKATVDAVFENGAFRPVQRLGLPEGARVRLTVERIDTGTGRDVLQLAAEVYAGLSAKDIEEIEAMSRRRPLRDSSR